MIEHIVLNWRMGSKYKEEEMSMSKYDEFDLDIKQDKSLDIVNPDSFPTYTVDPLLCTIIEFTLNICTDLIDCFSLQSDCSGKISECSPCGSGYRGIARC